ncbi:hypothetical protein DVH05_009355 [Phytophthora capsici]|nr:hypothetical protein DVH05_009355 [Phytophthora capsici]
MAKSTKGQGRKEKVYFTPAPVAFMKDTARDEDFLNNMLFYTFVRPTSYKSAIKPVSRKIYLDKFK